MKIKIVKLALLGVLFICFTDKLSAQSTTVGIDHVGMNVPDMDEAVRFFTEVMGFHKIYEEGRLPLDSNAKNAFNIRQNAEITRIAMLEAGKGSNIELFEYSSADRNMKRPMGDDVGWYHIALYTDDISKSVAYLKSKNVTVLGDPITHNSGPNKGITYVYFVTPWGLQIELVSYPKGIGYEKDNPAYRLWSPKDARSKIK